MDEYIRLRDATKIVLDNDLMVTNGCISLYCTFDDGTYIIHKDDDCKEKCEDKIFETFDAAFKCFCKEIL